MRIHHCYADGIALVRVMLSMTDAAPGGPPALRAAVARSRSAAAPVTMRSPISLQPLTDALGLARKLGAIAARQGRGALATIPPKAVALAEQGGALTGGRREARADGAGFADALQGRRPASAKRVAWADPLPLDEVKTIGRALGASVNDVLLSCVAGALRAYLVDKGDATDGVMIRALVPVNLRPLEKAYKLGNQFGLVFLELPIGIENPVERLYAVRANMRALKGSYPAGAGARVAGGDGAGPEDPAGSAARGARAQRDCGDDQRARPAAAALLRRREDRAASCSGCRSRATSAWACRSCRTTAPCSSASSPTAGSCPDPEHVIARFAPEFEKLVLTTLMARGAGAPTSIPRSPRGRWRVRVRPRETTQAGGRAGRARHAALKATRDRYWASRTLPSGSGLSGTVRSLVANHFA